MTLVILAAGMGSRYGGLKQIDPITGQGEFIIDFSVFDAIRAGFDKVVFVIKKENYELFKDTVGERISRKIKVEYVFQSLDSLPDGFSVPEARTKPWGTGHALLCAKDAVNDNFAVINADDFYGRDAYMKVADYMRYIPTDSCNFCMGGFILKNTLTDHGSVSRGVCSADASGKLLDIKERTKISRGQDGFVAFEENGRSFCLDENCFVSMNFWGFTPKIFDFLESEFINFLSDNSADPVKKEFYLPSAVDISLKAGLCSVQVIPTSSEWYGVTYSEDKPFVVNSIRNLIASGQYPEGLWA